MFDILNTIADISSTTKKLAELRSHADNEVLQRLHKLTLCRVSTTFGVGPAVARKYLNAMIDDDQVTMSLADALDVLEDQLNPVDGVRKASGHAAEEVIAGVMRSLSPTDQEVIVRVLMRNLRTGMGTTQVNKVWPDLIVKPVYMRCSGHDVAKTEKNVGFPAILQLKADGTFREFTNHDSVATGHTRQGEPSEMPVITKQIEANFPNGTLNGELVVIRDGKVLPRHEGNGLINSSNPPHEEIHFMVWDFISPDDMALAQQKKKGTETYDTRLGALRAILENGNCPNIQLIESHVVNSMSEAMTLVVGWMTDGLEGGVLKAPHGLFKNGTSTQQVKLKLEMEVDVRITGFKEGTVGTKRAATFGSIAFSNDEGTVSGYASGISDDLLKKYNDSRDDLLTVVMTVKCNDITKARNKDTYSLSHPRVVEIRFDKDETDTLDRIMEIKQTAISMGKV